MAKPPIGPAPVPKATKVHRINIEFDGKELRVNHPNDVILALGMLRLAEHEITAKLSGHKPGNDKMIIPAKRVPYPPEPKD